MEVDLLLEDPQRVTVARRVSLIVLGLLDHSNYERSKFGSQIDEGRNLKTALLSSKSSLIPPTRLEPFVPQYPRTKMKIDCASERRFTSFPYIGSVCALALIAVSPPAQARSAMTAAATPIDNIATVSLGEGTAQAVRLTSNRASLQVQEILGVRVDVLTPEMNVEAAQFNQRLRFAVVNTGNSREAFDLSLTAENNGFDPQKCVILVDWDGDDVLDMAHDRVSSVTPVLAPGASVAAWASCDIPGEASQGSLGRIFLRAYPTVLRAGTTPNIVAMAGNGGVDVVLGPSLRGGDSSGWVTSPPANYRVSAVDARLIKSQSIVDPDGGRRTVIGATITYRLEARVGAGAPARQVEIADPIPRGSTYVANSITLDGAPLTDATDDDAGRLTSDGIVVTLGDVPAQSSRIVTFKVRIGSPPLWS